MKNLIGNNILGCIEKKENNNWKCDTEEDHQKRYYDACPLHSLEAYFESNLLQTS
ncbi:hypothetical protein HanRHA438_Chr10g0461851 [Helianthus annuus]|nr:hypothetical protein HanRHA438_Chr10g0461851 [Helianthus annuus]